jgi:hypothetical protein
LYISPLREGSLCYVKRIICLLSIRVKKPMKIHVPGKQQRILEPCYAPSEAF